MSDAFMINVRDNFNLGQYCQNVAMFYQNQGFNVNVALMSPTNAQICFEKDLGGINTILGLGVGQKANLVLNGNTLTCAFFDAEWTSKIIGVVIGWFLCLIPLVTGIIGIVKQSDLPKKLKNDMTMIATTM